MRIAQLELRAFGPFTDTLLDFNGGDCGLHVVYGPNEAGKSAALRALHQLLYGIPHNSPDTFVHNNQQLRIAATLEHSDGRRLECVRRKGNKNTLRAADDNEVVPPEQLLEFLDDLGEEVFAQVFGIDHARLVRGGQEIVQGGGEIGQLLFSTGAGISNLRAIQQALDDEAKGLFSPQARKPAINQAIGELDKSRKALRESQLPSTDWVKHDQAWREATRRRDEIETQLSDRISEQQRLTRFLDALPAIAGRQRLLDEVAPLRSIPLLRKDFATDRVNAVSHLTVAQQDEARARQNLGEIAAELSSIDLPQAILDNAAEIAQLQQELGSHQKASRDRPQLVAELRQAESKARSLLHCIRPDLTLPYAESLRIPDAEAIRIRNLGARQSVLEKEDFDARGRLSKIQSELAGLAAQAATLQPSRDVARLRRLLHETASQGPLEEQLSSKRQQLEDQQRQAEIELGRLDLWSGTVAELETLPVPLAKTVEDFRDRFQTLAAAVEQRESRLAEQRSKDAALAAEIEALRIEQEVPTEDDLLTARQRRDAGWSLVQRIWRDGEDAPVDEQAYVAAAGSASNLGTAYEASVDRADDLADRLRREAERVQRKASLLADRQRCGEQLEQLARQLAEAQSSRTAAQQEWTAIWQPLGIAPRTPREMPDWLLRYQTLVERARSCRQILQETSRLAERIAAYRDELRNCFAAVGEDVAEGSTLVRLLGQGNDCVEAAAALALQWNKLNDGRQRLQTELPEAETAAATAAQSLIQGRQQWGEAVGALGLEATATVEEANAVLNRLADVFETLRDAANFRHRIEAIDRDAQAFSQHVAELTAQVAADLALQPAPVAAQELAARLDKANRSREQVAASHKRRDAETKSLKAAEQQIASMRARLQALCEEAGCQSPGELPGIEERSALRRDLEQQLRSKDEELLQRAAGVPLDTFIAEAQSHDCEQLQPRIAALSQEIEQRQRDKEDVLKTIGGERAELDHLNGNSQGAEAAEHIQFQLAKLAADVEQYARLRLAAAVLRQAVERYREKNQDPILTRANRLFAELTVGSFQGLRVEMQESGSPVLVGVRAGTGEHIGVEFMSEGTADQLYLALRLASLERYLEHKEPVPFVVDDILVQFDNERSVATLQALVQLSERTQVILFTHHEHLVELAQQHLDRSSWSLHKLPDRGAPSLARLPIANLEAAT